MRRLQHTACFRNAATVASFISGRYLGWYPGYPDGSSNLHHQTLFIRNTKGKSNIVIKQQTITDGNEAKKSEILVFPTKKKLEKN